MNTRFRNFPLLLTLLLLAPSLRAQLEKSLLWEVSGKGLGQPSYLYGTMHVGDKRAHQFSDATLAAFGRAKAYAGELDLGAVNPLDMLQKMKLDSGQTLHGLFEAEEWAKVEEYFKTKLHSDPLQFDGYNIFFLYSLIAQSQFKNQMGEAVDMHFYKEAKKAGKSLHGLETIDEQIGAINSMTVAEQKKMLLDAMDGKDAEGKGSMKKMMKYYAKGDLEALLALSDDADYGDNFESAFLTKRNQNMAERMVPLMEAQSTFVAVGALHLPGEEGVIARLRAMGYEVKALF